MNKIFFFSFLAFNIKIYIYEMEMLVVHSLTCLCITQKNFSHRMKIFLHFIYFSSFCILSFKSFHLQHVDTHGWWLLSLLFSSTFSYKYNLSTRAFSRLGYEKKNLYFFHTDIFLLFFLLFFFLPLLKEAKWIDFCPESPSLSHFSRSFIFFFSSFSDVESERERERECVYAEEK